MALYRGFSTVNELSQKKFVLTDYELVKQDLINRFNTRKGSRVMLPNEGCIVWELMFEPLTTEVKQAMLENLVTIISQDPRLELVDIVLIDQTDTNSITFELAVNTVGGDQTQVMRVLFDERGTASELNQ
jgi:phage baseplate assembly protein W